MPISPQPLVIAHRGASGYLPEHTLESKALAYGFGADYLEQDVIATRDGELVVLHDLTLDDTTDVADKFPQRRRADGHFYAIDFDLAEVRKLRVSERRRTGTSAPQYPDRFPGGSTQFRVNTLDEELDLVLGLNRATGRDVGIYAEIKDPQWHLAHGVDLSASLLQTLAAHGYRDADDAAFVQCFDAQELRRVRVELGSRLKLVQLVGSEPAQAQLLTAAGLRRVAEYANCLGPGYVQLVSVTAGSAPTPAPLVRHARAAGLALHPYTFRRDALPPYATSLEQLLQWFFATVGVDGLFCDFPDVAVRVRDSLAAR